MKNNNLLIKTRKKAALAVLAAAMAVSPCVATVVKADAVPTWGWLNENGKSYWYEGAVRQGTYDDPKGVIGDGTVRGREIYDLDSDGWYWLDSVYDGAKAVNKEVWMPYIYQKEDEWNEEEINANANASGDMAEQVRKAINNNSGKWVRYDENGKMIKGWYTVEGVDAEIYPEQAGNIYYYDPKTGLMAKGWTCIDDRFDGEYSANVYYKFDAETGVFIHPTYEEYCADVEAGLAPTGVSVYVYSEPEYVEPDDIIDFEDLLK